MPTGDDITRAPRKLSQFELAGRIVVWGNATRHYVNIVWRHDPRQDEILLTTPLGQGIAQLARDEHGARLVTADHRQIAADGWEGLAEQALGIRLPLNDLPDWLSGQAPAPTSGWHVEYREYQSDAADALPTLIEATRGDIGLRLKITEWVLLQ